MTCVIGIDFDNTIVSYNDVMFETAMRKGWIDKGVKRIRKIFAIKSVNCRMVRRSGNTCSLLSMEKGWSGRLIEGVQEFFQSADVGK